MSSPWSSFFFQKNFLQRLSFAKGESFFAKHSLFFLNLTQFLGVINDNLFKFLVVFLFIDLRGVSQSSEILFWTGSLYVLPFLICSSGAGIIADRYSKQKIIVILKLAEILIALFGVLAIFFQNEFFCYFLLFLLAAQSALFGPPKYSIIPEIVERKKITKANSIISAFTYLGVIVGTFLASLATQITGKNFFPV